MDLRNDNLRILFEKITSAADAAAAAEKAPPFHRLVLNVLKIVVKFVHPRFHKNLEGASRALMQAVWHRAPRLTTDSLLSLLTMAVFIAPHDLQIVDPPAEIVFRAGAFSNGAATSVAATANMASQPLLQNVANLPVSLVFDSCAPDLPALRSLLDLSTVNSLTVRGRTSVQTLTELLQSVPNLQTLNLERNRIGAAGAEAIAAVLKDVSQLQTLNLRNNIIGDAGAKAIAAVLKDVSHLQTLNLRKNNIGAAGAEAIAAVLKDVSQLQTLNLEYNNIGEAGAKAIAAVLKDVSQLQTLKLGGNSIGDAGAKAIAEAQKSQLSTLRVA